MIPETVADEIDGHENDLDETNDLEYLLGLLGDRLEDDDFEDDAARAKYAVAEWCDTVDYVPDIDNFEVDNSTPPDDVRDVFSEHLRDLLTEIGSYE
jgi:hypothetical protein